METVFNQSPANIATHFSKKSKKRERRNNTPKWSICTKYSSK